MADAVTDWSEISVPVIQMGRPGAIGFVDSALVQAAVHDAVQAIEGQFEPYYVKISGASGLPAAAAAAAAYGVLVGFYPAQAGDLTTIYQTYLTNNNLVNDPGLPWVKWWLPESSRCGAWTPAHFRRPSMVVRTRAIGDQQSRFNPGGLRLSRPWHFLGWGPFSPSP